MNELEFDEDRTFELFRSIVVRLFNSNGKLLYVTSSNIGLAHLNIPKEILDSVNTMKITLCDDSTQAKSLMNKIRKTSPPIFKTLKYKPGPEHVQKMNSARKSKISAPTTPTEPPFVPNNWEKNMMDQWRREGYSEDLILKGIKALRIERLAAAQRQGL